VNHERLVFFFRNWADVEAPANLSPLYAVFGHAVADDPELLAMASEALEGQPPPNIFFAAVHAVLANHPDEPLAQYYASLGGTKQPDADAALLLRTFCLERRDELLPIIRTRLTQTNEVRRSAVLLPAFASIASETGRPLSLIELGPSAGLNLLFDRYQYRYGARHAGEPGSPVVLDSAPRRASPDVAVPEIAWRVGIDINPLDITDEADVAWLRALLWPEHTDRLALMNAAIEVARREPPRLIKGDLFEYLPAMVTAAPEPSAICIFATFVLNQFSKDMLDRLRSLLLDLSQVRELHLVVMGFSEFIVPGSPRVGDTSVWILRLRGGDGEYRLSSLANPHGRWIDWQPAAPWQPWRPGR
jgi:hypothetical protein